MEKEKKVYTPPIAEPIMLVPSEEITAVGDAQSENWVPDGWQNKFKNQSTVQAFGKWVWNEDGTITEN